MALNRKTKLCNQPSQTKRGDLDTSERLGTLAIEIGHILGKAERQNKTKKDKNAQRTYKN